MMTIDIITLFPGLFSSVFSESIIKRAVERKLVRINVHNLRNFSLNRHGTVDDSPFGGGPGMVISAEPVYAALGKIRKKKTGGTKVILLSPQGKVFDQKCAKQLSSCKRLVFICAHYEGVDERVLKAADLELSIGDYVLTGGELPAMVVIDAVARLVPGVVKKKGSLANDSFSAGSAGSAGLLDYPSYTRPRVFRGLKVPEVLVSGNHEKIRKWRLKESLKNTCMKRPDLLGKTRLNEEQAKILKEIERELKNEQKT